MVGPGEQFEQLERARERVAELERDLGALWREVEVEHAAAQRVLRSRSWRLTRPLRAPAALLARRRRRRARIRIPATDSPLASVIVPVHGHHELIRSCLASIAEHTDLPYELIVVDDRAEPGTRRVLEMLEGARLVRNDDEPLGFTRSVNRGAREARASYLVICNDDIEVRPGWLSALVECAESSPGAAVVAPKYLFDDGRVLEAGSIVWRDGSTQGFGRGEDPELARFNYRREIDYGSGAALLVRAEFWREVGGLDERFVPAYYEDVDLCFAARAGGRSVLYEPRAEVVHAESATLGRRSGPSGKSASLERNGALFAEKWGAELEHQPPRASARPELRRAAERSPAARVLLIDHRLPAPERDAASVRIMHLVRALRAIGRPVSFLPSDGVRPRASTERLQALGVEVLPGGLDIRTQIEEIASELGLVIMSLPTVSPRFLLPVRMLAPQATLVYDTVDLHYLREQRRARVEGADEPPVVEALRALELALVRASDATICVSEVEAERLREEVPDARIELLPPVHEVAGAVPPAAGREGLLFVGTFAHDPNVDAARYLAGSVMPLVWEQRPDAVLRLVGAAPEQIRDLASDRVLVEGVVEDLRAVADRSRAMVAPLRYGAGVKGKITESLAWGLPIVTTPVGAEGTGAKSGAELLVGEDPAGLAGLVVDVLVDDELWARLSAGGLELARRRFSTERVGEVLERLPQAGERGMASGRAEPVRTG